MQPRTGGGLERSKYNCKFESNSSNYQKFDGREQNELTEMRVPSSWQKFNTEVGLHPTQKPLDLFRYLIRTYSNEGDLILDNCMGSETTACACIKEKRNFIGFELDKDYYECAEKRIKDMKNNQKKMVILTK